MSMLRRLLVLLPLLLCMPMAWAIDDDDLLPVEQAFVLSASAPSRDRIEVEWKIADGYYLYRHRTAVSVANSGFNAGELKLPAGKAYHDEFFGDVETYRNRLVAVLPGQAEPGADRITLNVKYQGCADVGICYPPQTRQVTVKLPPESAGNASDNPLRAPAGQSGKPLFGGLPASGIGNAPLPEEQAFGFEAIAYDGDTVLLRFTPAPGYYLYRDRTSMKLTGAEGISLQAPRWPAGKPYKDEYFGDVVVYFDQVEVAVPLRRTHAQAAKATLEVTFQGCQTDGICYPPMARKVALDIPKGTITPAAALDTPAADENGTIETTSSDAATPATQDTADANSTLDVPRTLPPDDVLRDARGSSTTLWLALLLALGGGLILNLMPCVLPVLSLKALSLADSGHRARSHALWYTAGVLASFLLIGAIALGLRAAGQALGWGFQLQQPLVVGLLAYVMFAVGLSLSGVFSVGLGLAGTGANLSRQSGPAGDFFTGVLAVVIASPCTAPFMGAALAFAFTASPWTAMLVFAALGLGLALPFLLIGFVPALANRLPRPGAWMVTLKQFLAFPMYLTAIWLLWVLGNQRGVDALGLALVGMVLLALGLWWFERLRLREAPIKRTLAVLIIALSLAPLVMAHRLPQKSPAAVAHTANSVPYSAEALAALRAEGRVVFVDMTADWCVTCKANESTVLDREPFRAAMALADATLMRGDWTNVDPAITAFLEEHRAVGVPLYVVYPNDGGEGEVLPTVLTQSIVEDALRRAVR